ncbi:toxin-antitoxin system TumE family protein [Desulfamplus magnetovallimortis]
MYELMAQIFRYDNAPHHSNINTFPHHKHEKGICRSATPQNDHG